jgi:hypothetical protein
MKIGEWENSVTFRTGCACFCQDHDVTLDFEVVNGQASYYCKTNMSVSFQEKGLKSFWKRLKASAKVLFTGRIEMEGDFIFKNVEHLEDFRDAINEGIRKCQSQQ